MNARGSAPDFTTAFLVSLAPLLFLVLCIVWVAWGLAAALGSGWAADRALARVAARAGRR